ncbi:UNVERIFIED_CONTAM: hypothetical protein K2H54_040140 [Gekko kuhli]
MLHQACSMPFLIGNDITYRAFRDELQNKPFTIFPSKKLSSFKSKTCGKSDAETETYNVSVCPEDGAVEQQKVPSQLDVISVGTNVGENVLLAFLTALIESDQF